MDLNKILLVDDDQELRELLSELLQLEGFHVETASNGEEALNKLDNSIELVLLDIMMPVLNGIETLKRIRQRSAVPVLMLTARGDDFDRVLGLELGADDYLPKPFHDRELVARIKAILRRTTAKRPSEHQFQLNQNLEFDGLTLYPARQQVMYQEEEISLTSTEFALLQLLILNVGKVVSREVLSLEVLGKNLTHFDRAIDMHMSNLRKKLPIREGKVWFKTVRGKGYILLNPYS